MAYSQSVLGRRFADGETTGTASNMHIAELEDGWTALVGYRHAAYAARSPRGVIVRFDGWYMRNARRWSGSPSTKGQMAQMAPSDIRVAYYKPSTDGERSAKQLAHITTDKVSRCAPKVSGAVAAAEWAIVEKLTA